MEGKELKFLIHFSNSLKLFMCPWTPSAFTECQALISIKFYYHSLVNTQIISKLCIWNWYKTWIQKFDWFPWMLQSVFFLHDTIYKMAKYLAGLLYLRILNLGSSFVNLCYLFMTNLLRRQLNEEQNWHQLNSVTHGNAHTHHNNYLPQGIFSDAIRFQR